MKTILVVNGEAYWRDFFPDCKVVQKNIQTSHWISRKGKLWVGDEQGAVAPDGILWRVGAIKPGPRQEVALRMIRLAGVPCVNSAACLLKGYDRLSMLGQLAALELPVIPFNVVTTSSMLKNVTLDYPFVVKAGNYHGGYGKIKIESEEQWKEIQDLLFVTEHYITTEPFINYQRDIRYIVVGEEVWAMSRTGKGWRANVETQSFEHFEPEKEWIEHVLRLKKHLGADILAIDVLEKADGTRYIVEYNDIPGLSGFSEGLKYELADILMKKMDL